MRLKIIQILIKKELSLEFRQGYAFVGLVLYLISSILIIYLTFQLKLANIHPLTWSALFWIVQLFTAISAVGKGFSQEPVSRNLYYYQLVNAEELIVAKIIYHVILMLILSGSGYMIFSLLLDNPIESQEVFMVVLMLGALGFASILTLISAIASKAGNNATLMAILSFPLVIPLLLMLVKSTHRALDGLELSSIANEIIIIFAINALVFTLSLILFPYIWKT